MTGITEATSENRGGLKQKQRGGYYTPLDLACFMSRFVLSAPLRKTLPQFHILEPSCGDGIFIQAVTDIMNHDGAGFPVTLEAIEKDAIEARKSRKRLEMAGA